MKSFLLALGFLTVIPVRTDAPVPGELGRSGMWFPVIGLVLAGLLVAAQQALSAAFPPFVAATLLVALWAALTGGLHLDGLVDCADGLLATASRERRLEILRDPRVGAFGVVALILHLLLKVHALGALLGSDVAWPRSGSWLSALHHARPLVASTVLARWVVLIVARASPARPEGWAADVSRGLRLRVFVVGSLLPLGLVAASISAGDSTLAAATIVAHVLALVVVRAARTRLGGITGDVLGLTIEVVELAVLLTFVAAALPATEVEG